MNQNDYVILFDENGSPYIAHAGLIDQARGAVNAAANRVQQVANQAKGVGRGVRQNHKYILKVNENGKTRYFYKQEEVRAYYEAKKRGIKNAAEYAQNAVKNKTATAADAVKDAATKAGTVAKNVAREVTGQAARDRMDVAAEKYPEVRKALHNSADEKNKKQIKYDEAERQLDDAAYKANKAQQDLKNSNWFNKKYRSRANTKAQESLANAYENYNKANQEYSKAETQWAKDLDKYDKVVPKAKEATNNVVTKAKAQFDRMKDEFRVKDQKESENAPSRPHSRNTKVGEGSVTAVSGEKVDLGGSIGGNKRPAASSRLLSSEGASKSSAKEMIDNAKNKFEQIKTEFKDKTGQTLKERAETAEKEAKDAERERQKAAGRYSDDVNAALKSEKSLNANPNSAHAQAERDQAVNALRKSSEDYYKDGGALDNAWSKRDEAAKAREEYNDFKKSHSAQAMIDQARTTVKDKAEDLSAKAKSTTQAAKESAQGMIENARSSTAKAVNEAWEKIPKNADGTVNPFDSNFQSAYNDWKSKKDKYDGSLTGQAKAVAEKATDSVKDVIDKAKKTAKDASQQISDNLDVNQLQKNLERDMKNHGYSLEDAYNQHKDWLKTMQSGQLPEEHKEYYKKMSELEDKAYKELKAKRSAKKYFNEYSDNDSDFAEKNYSKENHVEDTDFYSFKRKDGKSVILEEDMKWVLPKGVDAGDPAIKSALKKIANSGNFKSYDDWLENANDILGDAIEKVRDKEK